MSRTSPVHYIAPSAISLIPNANGSANDIAVHIASGTKIKVYCRTLGIDMVNATFQEWAIAGKNRRLANENVPYTIYARLPKTDKGKGYLIFAPKLQVDDKWTDKYCYITPNGMSSEGTADDSNWYVKIGDVSEVDNAQRILDLDTGILGTDQYNSEWNLNPDDFPLRVEIDCTINDEPAGSYPYVRWSEQVRLSARLLQGFAAATDLSQVDHWGIYKNLGEQAPELAPTPDWPDAQRKELFQTTGDITLYHSRDGVDDFDGAEACIFTVVAWGAPADATELDGGNPSYVQKAIATVTLHAETYEVLSSEDIPDEPEDFVPSDTTLFTGAAMDAYMKRYPHYFRKDQPDTDPHLASFGDLHVKKNLSTDPEDPTALSGGNMLVEGNAQVDGNAELKGDVKIGASASNKAIVNAVMQVLAQMKSQNYVDDNPLGKGGWNLLSADANGNSYFVIDKLFVRLKAIFNELEIRKISYAGGNIIFSHAGSEIVGVKPLYRNGSIYAYRCYCKKDDGTTATKNWWKEDDQAKCQTFNIEEGVHQNVKNTYYWRMVVAVGSERAFLDGTTSEELYNYVDLSLGDCDANSDIPKAGDSIIQMGNRTDTGRQGFISLEVFGSDAPAIKVYKGVNGYVLDDKRPIIISPKNTSMRVQHYEIETDYGVFPAVKERGDWDLIDEHKCYYFDRVQHNGSSWLCTYPQGSTPEYTTEEPSVNATYWKVDAQAGESAPSYTEEWYAWSNVQSVVNATTEPTPNGGWNQVIGGQGAYAYLWKKITRYTWNSATRVYVAGTSQYFRMSGTNGTSIDINGEVALHTDMEANGYVTPVGGTRHIADDGESYVLQEDWTDSEGVNRQGHLFMWSAEGTKWVPLGKFQGEDGKTFYTHVAWATSVTTNPSTGEVTNVTGFTIAKTADDTTHLWMGVYVDENSAADPADALLYTWSYTKGNKGDSITVDERNSKTEYVVSNQGTSAPASGWSTTIPSVPQGQFLWTRVTTAYSDGSSTTSYGVSYNAEDGTPGTSITITSKSVKYAVTNNGTQPADSSFSYNSIPPLELGQYLWTKTEVAYSDGNSTKAYSVSRLGTDGEDGQTGADGYTTHFAYATSADGSQGFSTTNFNGATYIGTYRDQNATDSTNYQDYTWTPWRGEKGDDAAALILSSSAVFIRTNNEGAVLDDFAREITLTMRTHSKELSLKSVDFTQSPNISDGASVLTTEGLVRSVMGSLVYLRNSGNSVSDNLLTITPTSHSIAPTSIVVTADKDSVLEEQTISFTATAVDEDGNEYTGYASMLIQRQYVAADGINGEDGEDGVSVYLENPAALFAQDVSNTSTITPLPSKTNIIVKRGNTTVPLTDYTVAKPSSGLDDTHCTYSVANTSTEKSVTISAIGTYAEGGNNYYYENGFARVNVTYEGTTYVLDYKFLLNAIGKFKRVVEGDVETSIASKKYYEYNPATGQYDKETTMGEFVRSSSKNTSVLTETKNDTISAMSEVLQKVDNISLTVYENKDGIDLFTHTDDVVVGTSWTTIPTTSNTTNCKTMCVSIPMEIEKKSADSTINFRIYTKNTSAGATIDTIIQSCTFNNGVLTSTGNKSRFNAITSYVRDSKEYVKGVLYFEKTQSSTFKMVDVGARNTGTTVSCTLFKSRKFSVGVSLKDGLIGTGIDIVNGKITNTADQWECQNNSGVKTAWLDDMGNFTVRGVYNNLITVIDENTWDKYIISHTENGVTEWYLDALLCGTFVELKYLPPSFSGMLNLPFYANDVIQKRGYTRYLNSSLSTPRLMTDNELRMLAGRKMVFRWDESIGGNSDTLGYIYAPQAYWGVNETAVTIAQVEARLQALMHGDKHFITLGSTWAAASAYNRSPSLEAPKTVFLSFELVKFHARQTNSYYSWGYIWMASEDGSTAAKDDINWD